MDSNAFEKEDFLTIDPKLKNCSVFNPVLISNPYPFIGPTKVLISVKLSNTED